MMKKGIIAGMAALLMAGCHESLEDRAIREAKEFTQKSCPMQVADGVTIDSMVFERQTLTVRYYYTLAGKLDTTMTQEAINQTRQSMLEGVRNTPGLRNYKEAGFSFQYTYFSTKHKGEELADFRFTDKEYQ